MFWIRRLLVFPLLAVALAGCAQSKASRYTDQAIRACGEGNVAWVNAQEGRFGCQQGSYSHDH